MADFTLLICDWYRRNKRDLPWRNTKNPYYIWLSEIILQQTRVDQGLNYYLKFISNYPTIQDLANASEQQVLNDWQGLGYYSRARNLHFTAKVINEKHNGIFPSKYEQIHDLKGIGSYTAAAIGSFAFDLPYAVLDGNVFRVLSRVFDIETPIDSTEGKKEFSLLAQELLPKRNASEYNQAIMEFGALHCTPTKPDCLNCELSTKCLSLKNKTDSIRPIKIGKTKVRKRHFHYFILTDAKNVILSKRSEKDIWQHLFEFPLLETSEEISAETLTKWSNSQYGLNAEINFIEKKHILSHQHIFATFSIIRIKCLKEMIRTENEIIIKIESMQDFPLPRLIDRFLDENAHKIFK